MLRAKKGYFFHWAPYCNIHNVLYSVYSMTFQLLNNAINQRIYICDRRDSTPFRLPNIWLSQPLPALSAVYTATCPSHRAEAGRGWESQMFGRWRGVLSLLSLIYNLFPSLRNTFFDRKTFVCLISSFCVFPTQISLIFLDPGPEKQYESKLIQILQPCLPC